MILMLVILLGSSNLQFETTKREKSFARDLHRLALLTTIIVSTKLSSTIRLLFGIDSSMKDTSDEL